jgi:ribokinase
MRDIVVVGSMNVDVSLVAEHLPRPGETVRAGELAVGPGGKGLNQAIAAARLGGRVHMVGCLGDDRFAEIPEQALAAAGVETGLVRRLAGERTGTAAIVIDARTRENAIAVAGGANTRLSGEHVRDAINEFRASGVLLVQLEAPLETVEIALDQAAECSVTRVFDPAPARELPDALLRKADVLTPNETEVELLTGIAVHDIESAGAAASRLCERSLGDVIVTLGRAGCVWAWASGFEHVPAPAVEAIDTTGAGDAFNGGLAVALARGERLEQAIPFAIRAGTAATLRRGAAASMPELSDVRALEGA